MDARGPHDSTESAATCAKCGAPLVYEQGIGTRLVCPRCPVSGVEQQDAEEKGPPDALIGMTMGHFEILEFLGGGGMGRVYRARQAGLERLAAVKVMHDQFAHDQRFVKRFCREARDAVAAPHPNIVGIFDFGQEAGYLYIAMEFVDGESLSDVLEREGRVPPARAVQWMRQVLAALGEAHAHGVVHRDIKPANILLTRKDTTKVADFGVAKRENADDNITTPGESVGTPLYMSPEAALGKRVDARSDLYSLGATFFHALAGRPPFLGRQGARLLLMHAHDPAPPLAAVAPDLPGELCSIIDRLLQKDPAQRYQTAQEVLDALTRAKLIAAPAPSAAEDETPAAAGADRPGRRGRRAALVALVAIVLGAGALVVALALGARRRERPQEWQDLFDGRTMAGWRAARCGEGFFGIEGKAHVSDGAIVLEAPPEYAAGVAYLGEAPRLDYEITFEAARVAGNAEAGGLVFPLGQRLCAWGIGGTQDKCGLEMVDGYGNHEQSNPTYREYPFVNGHWHCFRLQVRLDRVQAWVDERLVVDFAPAGHKVELWQGYNDVQPLGFYAARDTVAHVRKIRLRCIKPSPRAAPEP